MSISRSVEARRRGRLTKMNKLVADLYKEGKCRECSVNVTRMDFAKILGKFTKVKIQYESTPRPEKEKKITSPPTNSRLRSNENGMVLIHRSVYKEHPAKTPAESNTPRRRGRPPKHSTQRPTVTRYRIIFCEGRDSLEDDEMCVDASIGDILPALTADILPTDEWLVDYLVEDEPTNDRVYDRIAAQLEDLMYDSKPDPPCARSASDNKTDEFPSIMELLSEPGLPLLESTDKLQDEAAETKQDSVAADESKEEPVKTDAEPTSEATTAASKDKVQDETMPVDEQPDVARVNGSVARVGDRNVDVQSINYIVFKRIKDDECNRVVKCSKNLNYSIEMDGRVVELVGAPKHISCVEDLRLMLQIVHESELSSFYVLEQH